MSPRSLLQQLVVLHARDTDGGRLPARTHHTLARLALVRCIDHNRPEHCGAGGSVAGDFHERLPHELRVGDDHVCADEDVIHARGVRRVHGQRLVPLDARRELGFRV